MIRVFICLLLVLTAPLVAAQSDGDGQAENWYQVELLVFARSNFNTQETWPSQPSLNYPRNITTLIDPNSPPQDLDAGLIDEDQTAEEQIANNDERLQTAGEIQEENQDTNDQTPTPTIQAFTLLDKDDKQFSDFTKKLFSRGEFRQLFHQSWRQTLQPRSEAVSIVITGGEQFDDHYELEGSIKLGLERYLHIHTDLWLSDFVSRDSVDETLWPVLPKRPNPNASNNQLLLENYLNSFSQFEQPAEDTLRFDTQNIGETSFTTGDASVNGEFRYLDNPFAGSAENLYAVAQTVVMRQHRRMRSGELHYIDHPLMGLLIRITPYEPPSAEVDEALTPEDQDGQSTSE